MPRHALIDPEAERSVLAGMIDAPQVIPEALEIVGREDFVKAPDVFDAIVALYDRGESPTMAALVQLTGRGYHDLGEVASGASPGQGTLTNARIVAEYALRRRLLASWAEMKDRIFDLSEPIGGTLDLLEQTIAEANLPTDNIAAGPGFDDWLGIETEMTWLVPRLFERGERLILTGWLEGGGKTTLLRQFAMQASSGIRPFTAANPCDPIRVLMIDCENPEVLARRRFRALRLSAGGAFDDQSRLVVFARPEGLDLLGRRDRKWFTDRVAANRPDLVVIGPLYKLHDGDPIEERPAKALATFFDKIRVRYDFAMLIEAHTPQDVSGHDRPLRPYGASLWRRWPEMGFGLAKSKPGSPADYALTPWRDTRGDGDWPRWLQRGGQWPWMRANVG